MTSNNQSDIEKLGRQVGGQNAAAIAELVDSRIAAALAGLREELAELVARQAINIENAKAEGSPEVKAGTNEATLAIKDANAAKKVAEADPTDENVEKAEQKVEEAKQSVSETERTLAERMSAAEGRLDDHETRISKLEKDHKGLSASVEGLWVSVRANARAITYGTTAGFARIARITLAVLGIGVLVWLGIVLISPVTLATWAIGVSLACIAAGIVYLIMVAMHDGTGRGMPTQSQVLAEASADAGVDIVRVQH